MPLSKAGPELLFEEGTETFGTERLTGTLLNRLTHHVNVLEMNGESAVLTNAAHASPSLENNPHRMGLAANAPWTVLAI